jgi:adenine phosphoribosyltransferase
MIMDIESKIRKIPDHPKPGILFYDITTLLLDPEATSYCIDLIVKHFKEKKITKVLGAESRGFIFGVLVAEKMRLPFVPVRKCGKLPAATERIEYTTEYSTDCLEVHSDAISEGDKVLIVDDLLATGGTALAQAVLVERLGADVVGFGFVIEMTNLHGKKKIQGYDVFSVLEVEG